MAPAHLTRRSVLSGGAGILGTAAFPVRRGATAELPDSLGPDYAPPYALPPYDISGATIPADALDAADFPTVRAWLDAMADARRAGKIGSGMYDASGVGRRRLHTSIYGYGDTQPILRSTDEPCILYFSDSDISVRYLRFETPNLALASVDRGANLIVAKSWRSADLEGPERNGSRALEHDADISGIRIADCVFTSRLPIAFMSQYHRINDIHIARNRALRGCFGFAYLRSDRFGDIRIYQNDIADLDQRGVGNHVGTIIWVGSSVDNSENFPLNKGVYIENNRIENVTGSGSERDYNSAVAVDVRECSETVIRRNIIKNVVNTVGHVDSNGIYAKSSVLLEENHIENCGASADGRQTGEAGSEGSLLTFKGGSRCETIIRNNRFIAGTRTDVPMLLLSHTTIIDGNRFEDWRYDGDHLKRDAMIRSYSGGPIAVINPEFVNCGTASGNPHRAYAVSGTPYEGGNITARNFSTSFDGTRTDVFHNDITIENCFDSNGRRLVVGYDEDVERVIAAATTTLSQRQKVAMDVLVRDLTYDGIWPRLHALYLLHASDEGAAGADWRNPSGRLTAIGNPSFRPYAGYAASADGQRLATSYNPVAEGLPADNCMIAVALDDPDERSAVDACGNAALSLVARNVTPADTHAARLASLAPAHLSEHVGSAKGLHVVQRTSADVIEHFKDGEFLGVSQLRATGHHDSALTILSREDDPRIVPYTAWAFTVGLSLDERQHRRLKAVLFAYRQQFGR